MLRWSRLLMITSLALPAGLACDGGITEDTESENVTLLNAHAGGLPIHIFLSSETFDPSNRLDPAGTRVQAIGRGNSVEWVAGRDGVRITGANCGPPQSGSALHWTGTRLDGVNYSCTDKP